MPRAWRPREIILRPHITEKSMAGLQHQNAYCFVVAGRANKIQIREAIEKIFDVRVKNVNTLVRKGKRKRFRLTVGKKPDWKKAIVTLEPNYRIDII
ncbi:MAG: 50S ribosomal protein L23 [Planctomycetota bacterium]|nr:50S ribosomal protein L23 [Planctomycetota bacterium]